MTLGVQGLHTEHYPPNILRACFLFLVLGSWPVGAWTLACQRQGRWLFLPQRPDLSLLQSYHQRDMCEYVEGSWEHKSAGHSVHPPLFWEGQPPAPRECFHFSNSPMVRSRKGASPSVETGRWGVMGWESCCQVLRAGQLPKHPAPASLQSCGPGSCPAERVSNTRQMARDYLSFSECNGHSGQGWGWGRLSHPPYVYTHIHIQMHAHATSHSCPTASSASCYL